MDQFSEQVLDAARQLLAGTISPEEFLAQSSNWSAGQVDNQLADASLDIGRRERCGFPEVVYAEGKSPSSLLGIVDRLLHYESYVLLTRVSAEQVVMLRQELNAPVHWNEIARTARVGEAVTDGVTRNGHVCVVTAGTTDIPVAEEARETLVWMGVRQELIADVGVAGPHRLLTSVPRLRQADAIIVVAGMEGALPSVVAGHVACPIFAVPTSVGYGANLGGFAALLSMLNSCAANVAVVNINAGFKAGYLAGLVRVERRRRPPRDMPIRLNVVARHHAEFTMSHQQSPPLPPLPRLPARSPDSHKGDYRRTVLIGGSRGMSGAIALAGLATLRGGAGLVTLATASSCLDTVAGIHPSYMTNPLPDDACGRIHEDAIPQALELAAQATCVALGPGLGRSEALQRFVLALYRHVAVPMVVDADALNALAQAKADWNAPAARVLTPHPGEFRRMMQAAGRSGDQADVAVQWATHNNLTIVLKGHRTLVTAGGAAFRNSTGNAGMATAGSGDVLTGVITALICQGLPPFDAARLGVYLHGLAGDLATKTRGMISLISTDICDCLPEAILQYEQDGACRA